MKHFNRLNKGFTLIELLVVISIIALLLSILMPSLGRAKELARFVVCRSNIKNNGMAGILWAEDNDGWAPPALWDRGNPKSNDGLLKPYLSAKTGDSVMHCPAVPKKYAGKTFRELDLVADAAPFANPDNYFNSYGINMMICSPQPQNCPGQYDTSNHGETGDLWGEGAIFYYERGNCKLFTIDRPDDVIFFGESVLYISAPYLLNMPIAAGKFKEPADMGRRHNQTVRRVRDTVDEVGEMNIAWIDGSVSNQPDDLEYLDDSGIPKINYKYWTGKSR